MKRYSSNDWMKAGGVLGAAILLARFAKLPLATIIAALPFILPYLKQAENAQSQAHSSSAMTREEAALILGIPPRATSEQVKEAHRRLITKNHPDTGGSDYLAAKINQARDVLLG
ncbi:MAG: DnaJ domain-containing protein [Rickettsiales bacterium]|nr:DnaJ domain-containing protein [Rickettsiales bacterium]